MLISVKGTDKTQLQPSQESMVDAPVLSHGCLVRNHWPKPTGVLEHCREVLQFTRRFFLTASLRRPKMSTYISLLTVLQFTSCNNSCKFYQRIMWTSEATTYSFTILLWNKNIVKLWEPAQKMVIFCTRVGTLIVATIYLQLIQNRYMFRSFTVLHCSHQHCVQPVASDVEVVGYL